MNIIAWNKQTDLAVSPEIAPNNGEWSYNKKTKTKRQYNAPLEPDKSVTERVWRDSTLLSTDSMLQSDRPDSANILTYRQELRDYPSSLNFPNGARPTL